MRRREIAAAELNVGECSKRGAVRTIRFDQTRRFAGAVQIVNRDLREHDVVQHPAAKRPLVDLPGRCERLMNGAVRRR